MVNSNNEVSSKAPNSGEAYDRGIFGQGSNLEARFIPDHERLVEVREALYTLGLDVVLTMGTFDIAHVGHARYLERARRHGDVLIVGVDNDEKVRQRKGPNRPVVPEAERIEMLSHIKAVDIVTLKYPHDKKWQLIETLHPDTLVAVEGTYDVHELTQLEQFCSRIIILERQAETSTTAKIRRLHTEGIALLGKKITELIERELNPDDRET